MQLVELGLAYPVSSSKSGRHTLRLVSIFKLTLSNFDTQILPVFFNNHNFGNKISAFCKVPISIAAGIFIKDHPDSR